MEREHWMERADLLMLGQVAAAVLAAGGFFVSYKCFRAMIRG